MIKSILVWIVALPIAVLAASQAIGNIAAHRNPDLVLDFPPANGRVMALAANLDYGSKVRAAGENELMGLSERGEALARRAFRLEPTATESLALLAIGYEVAGDNERSNAVMRSVTEITRRNAAANLWVSRALIQQGRQDEALRFFDITMRTSPSATNLLLPEMMAQLGDESVIGIYADLLARKPPWHDSFWYLAFRTPDIVDNLAKLRSALIDVDGYEVDHSVDETLLKQLVANDMPETAWSLYRKLSGSSAQAAGDLLESADHELVPFDWEWVSTGEFGSAPAPGRGISVSALPSTPRSIFARRLFSLPAGNYAVHYEVDRAGFEGYELTSTVRCAERAGEGRSSVVSELQLSQGNNLQRIERRSADCRFYWIELSVATESNTDPQGFVIKDIRLTRMPT